MRRLVGSIALLVLLTLGAPAVALATEPLVGSEALPSSVKTELINSGVGIASAFTAAANGNVVTLKGHQAREGAKTSTSQKLALYGEGSAKPGTKLAECTHSGSNEDGVWFSCTVTAVAVTSGTKYWLASLPLGGNMQVEQSAAAAQTQSDGSLSEFPSSGTAFSAFKVTGPYQVAAFGEETGGGGSTVELATKSLEKVEAITAELKALKVYVEGGIKVTCTSGCTGGGGGGSGGEVELTTAAKASVAEGDKKAVVFLVGVLMGLVLMGVVWKMVKP